MGDRRGGSDLGHRSQAWRPTLGRPDSSWPERRVSQLPCHRGDGAGRRRPGNPTRSSRQNGPLRQRTRRSGRKSARKPPVSGGRMRSGLLRDPACRRQPGRRPRSMWHRGQPVPRPCEITATPKPAVPVARIRPPPQDLTQGRRDGACPGRAAATNRPGPGKPLRPHPGREPDRTAAPRHRLPRPAPSRRDRQATLARRRFYVALRRLRDRGQIA